MHMKVLLGSLLLFSAALHAQLTDAGASVRSACAIAVNTPLPPEMVGLPIPNAYPTCDSYDLYENKRFSEARACAMQERLALLARLPGSPSALHAAKDDSYEPQAAGSLVVLTELYANAEGVPRDPALASRFLCEAISTGEVESDVSETKNILATLDRLKSLTTSSPRLIFCDVNNADLGPPEGIPLTKYCEQKGEEAHAEMHAAGIQAGIDEAQEDADNADAVIKPVLARLSATQRAAYQRAAKAMRHFISVQATGDLLFMGGYGSGGLYPNEMRAAFENQVVAFAQKSPSAPSAAEFAAADADLNTVYRHLIAAVTPYSDVIGRHLTPDNLRTEQRAWLAYRDAMVAFGETLAPSLPPSAWLLPLTTARTSDLKQVHDDAKR
jgi:uncharacterized protein YecT (DUF1311 family)